MSLPLARLRAWRGATVFHCGFRGGNLFRRKPQALLPDRTFHSVRLVLRNRRISCDESDCLAAVGASRKGPLSTSCTDSRVVGAYDYYWSAYFLQCSTIF